jgi:glycosyltransferase involved in cell wall biosynthesis
MKIGIDISQLAYVGTGVATYTKNLVKYLLALESENSFSFFGSSLRRQAPLIEFLHTLSKSSTYESKLFSFPPTFLEVLWNRLHVLNIEKLIGQVDVFHTSDWVEPPARARKVTTVHDLVIYVYPETLPERIIDTQKHKLSWVKKETDLIIADSQSTKGDIMKYLKINENKIKVIYLGVDEWQTFQVIIEYLERSYKIIIEKDGVVTYIWNPEFFNKIKNRPEVNV